MLEEWDRFNAVMVFSSRYSWNGFCIYDVQVFEEYREVS